MHRKRTSIAISAGQAKIEGCRPSTRLRPGLSALLLSTLAMLWGCGKPFDVRTEPLRVPAGAGGSAEVSGLEINAAAITDEDALYDTFDANLLMAGFLTIRVGLKNDGRVPIVLRKARFRLQTGGDRLKAIEAKRVFKSLISYYSVTAYRIAGYKESKTDFLGHALNTSDALPAGESRAGLIFFPLPPNLDSNSLLLVVERMRPEGADKDLLIEIKVK
jgi:hypothetical protein